MVSGLASRNMIDFLLLQALGRRYRLTFSFLFSPPECCMTVYI